jgi:phosphatidylglycerophosphatase A
VKKLSLLLATGFGIGLFAPVAPGTIGSLPGVALAYAMALLPVWLQVAVALALAALAVPICGSAEKTLGIKDDGRICADEWMLFPIAVVGIPLLDLPWWSMAVFFCVVRLVDILKPWPCRSLQAIPGGMGIVIDDFFANVYSLVFNWILFCLLFA